MLPGCSIPAARREGVALVIVLAFVVLLTGVIVAFFSRAVSERQISNSSTNAARTDLFAAAAVAAITGDFKQEIAAGSTVSQPMPQPQSSSANLYLPASPATAVPCLAGATSATLPNLLKQSAYNAPFFVTTGYNTSSYPPSNRATNVSSTAASQNGRIISLARWNKALLLPKQTPASDADFTPAAAFTAPNWIAVARDGTNPTAWDAGKSGVNGSNPVMGRYAYNIYDEGGLLDMNAAGYPDATGVPAPQGNYPAYKQSLAFADLTQLPGISDLLTSTPSAKNVIQTLVGWRNYASSGVDSLSQNSVVAGSPVSGSVNTPPGYNWSARNVSNYLNMMQSSGFGFMRTANSLLVNDQSDRFFTGRQQLLNLLLNSVADQTPAGAAERASLQNAVQYLGTFSRSLNQPSFTPAFPNDSTRPIVQSGTGGNTGAGGDSVINPSFLASRVAITKVGGRNDGSDLIQGEPLVKKRFALNRLAWLTYKGPSAGYMSDASVQAAITAMGGNPANINDPAYIFVQQGTAQNIYNYFGLSWVADPNGTSGYEWIYSHQGVMPVTSAPAAQAASISTLGAISGREADYFELLKASMAVGSVAKAYTAETGSYPDGYNQSRKYQTTYDTSTDAAILQLGANIIDQFDSDGYPTRILFNNGLLANGVSGKVQEYRGVEDLPYLYRIREGKLRIKDASVTAGTGTVGYTSLPVVSGTIQDAGQCVMLQEPEVWNPHYWNQSAVAVGARPTNLRIIAVTEDPNGSATSSIKLAPAWRSALLSGGTNAGLYLAPSGANPAQKLTAANTELLFNNQPSLFREPTMLIKPGVPYGSNLQAGGDPSHLVTKLAGGSYFTSLDAFPFPSGLADDKKYLGFPVGGEILPLAWTASLPAGAINSTSAASSNGVVPAQFINMISGDSLTYRLQYADPSGSGWCTYDEKYAAVIYSNSYNTWYQSTQGAQERYGFMKNAVGGDITLSGFDPRTARFGMHYSGRNGRGNQGQIPPPDYWAGYLPAAAAQMADATNRPDEYQGYIFDSTALPTGYSYNCGPSAQGWYVAGLPGVTTSVMRPGLISQNNPATAAATSNLRMTGDQRGGYVGVPGLTCFADADGVVRRAMGAHVQPSAAVPADPANSPSGQPLKASYTYTSTGGVAFGSGFTLADNGNAASRPMLLNRPFRSVAELGYVFSGTPWRNLDFFTPESGSAAMLDVFCVSDAGDVNGIVAGKVNLNTRQAPVLQSIISGAYRDESAAASTLIAASGNSAANQIAAALVARTSDTATGAGPLRNVSELVGRYAGSQGGNDPTLAAGVAPYNVDGGKAYLGFSGTTATTSAPPSTPANLSDILSHDTTPTPGKATRVDQRWREAAMRALTASGQTRIWNVMIDIVAQTGRYPQSVGAFDKFFVEGEQRYWVHLAIDRYTGAVIDKQIEIVKE